jgi:hypothetical protein
MRFYEGLDPAFARLNAGAKCLDVAGPALLGLRFPTRGPDFSAECQGFMRRNISGRER